MYGKEKTFSSEKPKRRMKTPAQVEALEKFYNGIAAAPVTYKSAIFLRKKKSLRMNIYICQSTNTPVNQ